MKGKGFFHACKYRLEAINDEPKKKAILWITSIVILIVLTILPWVMWIGSDMMTRGLSVVRGPSMEPTIVDMQIVYVKPVDFERGEVVVATCPSTTKYPNMAGSSLLKRIVGLPGEVVEITDDGILINGELLEESYVTDMTATIQEENEIEEIILSDNEYFLVGDNRHNSFDSRHVGAIHSSNFLYAVTTSPNQYTKTLLFGVSMLSLGGVILSFAAFICILVLLTNNIVVPQQLHARSTKSLMRMSHDVMTSKIRQEKKEPIKSRTIKKDIKFTTTEIEAAKNAQRARAAHKKKKQHKKK